MTLDRKDYKTAIPQLEKRLSAVEGQTSKGLAGFDVLQAALEAEKLARQKAVLKVDEGIDLVTVKMFYALVDPNDYVGGLPPASTVWSETMPEMDATSVIVAGSNPERKRVLWYKSKTLRNGNVVNESPPQQIQLMDGVFSFVNTVASNSGWTTIDGGSITTGIIQASQGDSFFNLNDGTFQVYSSVTGQGMIWNGATLYLGNSTGRHAEIKGGGLYVYSAADDPTTLIAQLGYGSGKTSTGSDDTKPFYTLGQRATASGRTAVGNWSTVEGTNNQASGYTSHAEGTGNDATGNWSHVENSDNKANGLNSHAGGWKSQAKKSGSFAHGFGALVGDNGSDYQVAIGVYNAEEAGRFLIGGGTENARKTIFKVAANGDVSSTGRYLTSFNSSVAMGSYMAAASTIGSLVDEVRFSSGCAGSVYIQTQYTGFGVTIKTGWYNFMYMPHRTGGKNGSADGDNANYGTLLLCGMNNSNGRFFIRVDSAAIMDVAKIMTTSDTPQTFEVSATTTTGAFFTPGIGVRYGKVVQLVLQVSNNQLVPAGGDMYVGTLRDTPAPATWVSNASYYGKHSVVASLNTSNVLTVRNASSTDLLTGSDTTLSFTYITND